MTVRTSKVLLFVFQLFPENCERTGEHFLQPRHVNLHVIVVVAGSGTKTAQVSKMGEMEKQQLKQSKPFEMYEYNFFPPHVALCCTALYKPAAGASADCTAPHPGSDSVIAQNKSTSLPEVQRHPEPLDVTVMDQFYEHVLLHFYRHD